MSRDADRPLNPHVARFLSDFTLGFSDGLTVPFALTAGLSSLGRAQTVIYAGLAELCAGSISMGIGGYLSALDEVPHSTGRAAGSRDDDASSDIEEMKGMLLGGSISSDTSPRASVDHQSAEAHEYAVRRHLQPLGLSNTTIADILASIRERPDGLQRTASTLRSHQQDSTVTTSIKNDSDDDNTNLAVYPIFSGMSISLGYLIGGAIPLFPYFFASTVGLALRWSIGLCLVALFSFGFGKSWLLRGGHRASRARLARCIWEGLQMLVLGTLAALAAVLCVHLVNGGDGASAES